MSEGAGFLLDSNVLIDVFSADRRWGRWSADALAHSVRSGPTFTNPIIFAEVSVGFREIHELDTLLSSATIRKSSLPYAAGFLAAKAHVAYRRRGGSRIATLPDFFIGAHAVVENLTLVTRDPKRYRSAFPTIRLLVPDALVE